MAQDDDKHDHDTESGARGEDDNAGRRQGESAGRSSRVLSRLAKRLQNPRELGGDAMELFGAIVESSDRVKTEAVRMVAREVRTYLEELKLKEGLRDLVTGHSLEVHVSLSLKPLAERLPPDDEDPDEEAEGPPAEELVTA